MPPTVTRRSYTAEFKLQAIKCAADKGNREAARQFNINEKMVRDWRKAEEMLKAMKKTKKADRGHKARWPQLEDCLHTWILGQRADGIMLSTLQVRSKAQILATEMNAIGFVGGPSWCFRFMKRKRLMCQRLADDVKQEIESSLDEMHEAPCDLYAGKLHNEVVHMQLIESTSTQKLEKLTRKCNQLEAQAFRSEQKVDEKDADIFFVRRESSNRMRHLKMNIQEYRRRFAGSVPLVEQEKFTKLLLKLQADKIDSELQLQKATEERSKAEERLLEVEVQHDGVKELIESIKDGKGAQKVWEWHKRMQDVRVEGSKVKRENDRLKEKFLFMENMTNKLETEIKFLEEDKIRLTQDLEENEMEWEHREVELERTIASLHKMIPDHHKVFPDVSPELDAPPSVDRGDRVKRINEDESHNFLLSRKVEDLEIKIREKEGELLRRDRVIAEMRLRIPTLFGSTSTVEADSLDSRSNEKFVRVTQQVVEDLRVRLEQKEETICRYMKLIENMKEDHKQSVDKYQKETNRLQSILQSKRDSRVNEAKRAIDESLAASDRKGASREQTRRVAELEELLTEQELLVRSLQDDLDAARGEVGRWRVKFDDAERRSIDEQEKLKRRHLEELRRSEEKAQRRADDSRQQLDELRARNSQLEDRLRTSSPPTKIPALVQTNFPPKSDRDSKTPVAIMKRNIDSLRHELACKDEKIRTLSKTLLDLRADMPSRAEMDVRLNSDAVKKNSDSRLLQEKVEELDAKVKKLKDENRRSKEREAEISAELEVTQDSMCKKENQLKKCQQERDRLLVEVEDFKQKVERMNTMAKQRPETEGFYQELDELRRRNRLLSMELEKVKVHPEKPYEHDVSKDEKQWEKKCQELKFQLKEKDSELLRLNSINSILKSATQREKENHDLLQRGLPSSSKREVQQPIQATVQELRRENRILSNEVSSLRQERSSMCRDVEELQSQNKLLSATLSQTEKKRRSGPTTPGERGAEHKELLQRENNLKKEMIALSEKNLHLNFELEQAHRDVPRLKEKMEDQRKYIEVLKSERKQREMISRSRESLSSVGSRSSSVRKVGESGRSTEELEKIISVLKGAVDKKKREIDELKSRLDAKEKEVEVLRSELKQNGDRGTEWGEKKLKSLERELLVKEDKIQELENLIKQMKQKQDPPE